MVEHWPPTGPWPAGGQLLSLLVFVEPVPADGWRSDEVTMRLREAYYRIMRESFERIGVDWRGCLVQPRGNGAVILLPQSAPPSTLAAPLPYALLAGLRAHNDCYNESARLRLRMAAHMGTVQFDQAGPAGHNVESLLSLLESAEFGAACADADADFGIIVSERLHEDVVRHSGAATLFRPLKVGLRGDHVEAWAWFRPGLSQRATAGADLSDLFEQPLAPAGGGWSEMPPFADLQRG